MNIMNYSREQIKQFVNDSICPVQALRDYEILSALKSGEKVIDIAAKQRISERQVFRIRDKYMR